MKEGWTNVDDLVRKMEEVIKRGDADKLPRSIMPGQGQPISSEQTKYLIENSRPLRVEAPFETAAPTNLRMSMALLQASKGSFFVTSDNRVCGSIRRATAFHRSTEALDWR
jgi:hypothetical protein